MKRLIAYFVSGVRTGSFFYLALLLLGQLFPQLIYPKVSVGKYFSPLYDEWLNGDALVDFGRP